ncbi:MAG: putative sporulation protein YtxC [Clostridium sp.]|jgi:putative sporulation protein YtxC|uniref:putative sporulation protein YtxC n=1 Tax=Clostridium sp. TaxID=1506 RepID=UPI0025C0F7B0|nr:putative sporulation protein YtxC [Clostridium sp.]MCH3962830.1 putative sporulation protein YtxC [Clostridium sp.]MCI1715755.1 putative sporulation protein YtxC [Clostridium sp.]MCI1800040.1 putative sporulation protein YtxC [Clostridium sp.]MCI1813954.1 putative sporulation protein YtxC [Clostridium sp.]MCI1870852.1 putative sporulation protein YtxC [Clostridium sp.]
MPLLILVYKAEKENIINGIRAMREYFKGKNINIGISEKMESDTHFLKIFSDSELNERLKNIFNIYIADILYSIMVDEFYKKDMDNFLSETYFFLNTGEIEWIKKESINCIKGNISIIDENSVYCINKKNDIIEKIIRCIDENNNINVEGFVTFRMKNILDDFESIVDKVVEKYMVEKEYDEFIKLLKYFVEIQESKIDYLDIVIQDSGNYIIRDENGADITNKLFNELDECRNNNAATSEDMLISTLITNAPERISIHSIENCRNEELIDTIQKVFTDRVKLFNKCNV